MEIEQQQTRRSKSSSSSDSTSLATESPRIPDRKRLAMLTLNIIMFLIGGCGAPLIIRVYFLHGGSRKWFSAFLQTAAFPLLLPPFLQRGPRISPFLIACATGLGLLTGLDNFLYSYGLSYLPVSTSSLLFSTQLAFTAVLAFLLVRQKFAATSVNAVVLLTFGAVILGVHADGDRPEGESNAKYALGFVTCLCAAFIYGLMLPLIELMYVKSGLTSISFSLVLQIQFVISLVSTAFCVVGMVVNNDFQAISREAQQFGLGKTKYYVVVIFTAIICQFFFLGAVGTINYSSALLGGVIGSVCIPITEVLAVFMFNEHFDGEKGVALALSIWGTASYFYGEYRAYKRSKAVAMEVDQLPVSILHSASDG